MSQFIDRLMFFKKYEGRFAFALRPSTDLESVVRVADVVVTITPARGPIVRDEWIAPGTHIAAVGADIERIPG